MRLKVYIEPSALEALEDLDAKGIGLNHPQMGIIWNYASISNG